MTETPQTMARRSPDLHIVERKADRSEAGLPRVVLVHGSMDTSASFGKVDDCLRDFAVTRYDRRGYGRSLRPGENGTSIGGHVDDLLKVLEGEPAFVAGHSLGGVITLAAAARAPELVLGALVYEAPMPWLPWWPPVPLPDRGNSGPDEVRGAAEAFMRRHMGDERWARLSRDKQNVFLDSAHAWVEELWTAAHSVPPPFEPERLGVPVVSVYGTETDQRHIRAAEELAERVPGARLERIEGSGHPVHRSAPAQFAGLIRRIATEIG